MQKMLKFIFKWFPLIYAGITTLGLLSSVFLASIKTIALTLAIMLFLPLVIIVCAESLLERYPYNRGLHYYVRKRERDSKELLKIIMIVIIAFCILVVTE